MQKKSLRAAVAQMVSTDDIAGNLAQAEQLVREAAELQCEWIVLPENFAVFSGGNKSDFAEWENAPGQILQFLSDVSQRWGIWVVAGSAPFSHSRGGVPAPEGKVYSGCSVWTPEGECAVRYDKMHLFDAEVADGVGRYRESDQFCPGDQPVLLDTPWGGLGLSICYDLRFPELYRALAAQGMNFLTVPAAFTYQTGEAHWEVLLRARAIENQCFVLASNQGGHHGNNRVTWGHSCIIDPWGDVLTLCRDTGSALLYADLDIEEQQNLRRSMPVLQHRRLGVDESN